jgi:hypothetical protein
MREDLDEQDLLERGLGWLREVLHPVVSVEPLNMGSPEPDVSPVVPDSGADMIVTLSDSGGYSRLLLEAKRNLSPLEARTVLTDKVNLMHRLTGQAAVLVVAPWLSPRTRAELRDRGFGYLDLSGNVWLRLSRPTVLIDKEGAQRDPQPRRRTGTAQLAGPKAGRLVRFLVDYRPPYRASEVAAGADLSQPYVSRLLDALDDQALITRRQRMIVDVDWRNLLTARAERANLLKLNTASYWIAPQGSDRVLDILRHRRESGADDLGAIAVTGSWAAAEAAPVSVGGQLMLYATSTSDWPKALRLLGPRASGGDVVLLEPGDPIVFDRTRTVDGLPLVALSQLAVDLLSGTGRMPVEGQALLDHMQNTEDQWRLHQEPARRDEPRP